LPFGKSLICLFEDNNRVGGFIYSVVKGFSTTPFSFLPSAFFQVLEKIYDRCRKGRSIKIITGAGLQDQGDIWSPKAYARRHQDMIEKRVDEEINTLKRKAKKIPVIELEQRRRILIKEMRANFYWEYLERARIRNWSEVPANSYFFLHKLLADDPCLVNLLITTNYDLVWDAVLSKTLSPNQWIFNPILPRGSKEGEDFYNINTHSLGKFKVMKIHGSLSHIYLNCCQKILKLPSVAIEKPSYSLMERLPLLTLHTFDPTIEIHGGGINHCSCRPKSINYFHYIDNNFATHPLYKDDPRRPFRREIDEAVHLLQSKPDPAGVLVAGFRVGKDEELGKALLELSKRDIPIIILLPKNQEPSGVLWHILRSASCYYSGHHFEQHLAEVVGNLICIHPDRLFREAESKWKNSNLFQSIS
jgi:hypothetical protein